MTETTTAEGCRATKATPNGGPTIPCTAHRRGWHGGAVPPHRMVWPARLDACPQWKATPTAQGETIVYCGTSSLIEHDRHEGTLGPFPVRWTA